MITTPLGELAFIDQILAALNDGPATTEDVCQRVGTVICACPLCEGPRPARLGETRHFLFRLLRAGRVRSEVVAVPGLPCPDCGKHDMLTLRWEKVTVDDDPYHD